ncbi:hypothetical protein GCM10010990_11330 [Croceicoccus mobilis]|uniref:Uncharacterized protein n=1 Tax=Croceicoccus mobilis TaxID=1703339 RepID=A0A916YWT6_9SPHN|nr:hypothetical protein GCM10010990_11330 [Croceicoccus mobilis]
MAPATEFATIKPTIATYVDWAAYTDQNKGREGMANKATSTMPDNAAIPPPNRRIREEPYSITIWELAKFIAMTPRVLVT